MRRKTAGIKPEKNNKKSKTQESMDVETERIEYKLDEIKSDLSFIKKRLTDMDYAIINDDLDAIKEAEADLRSGKTKRL